MTIQEMQAITPEIYRQILDKLKLKTVSIDELNATCNRDLLSAGETTINLASKTFSRQTPDEYFAYITYQLAGLQGKTSVLKIETTFCVIFDISERVPDSFSEIFKDQNLPMTTLPYLREVIASLTGRMGLPILTIPYNIYSGSEAVPTQAQTGSEELATSILTTPPKRRRQKKE